MYTSINRAWHVDNQNCGTRIREIEIISWLATCEHRKAQKHEELLEQFQQLKTGIYGGSFLIRLPLNQTCYLWARKSKDSWGSITSKCREGTTWWVVASGL